MNDLGKIIDRESGEVLAEMFGPPNALTAGADSLSGALYALSETIIRGLMPKSRGGGLGGEFGYGVDFENEVFMMHHFCWCEKEDCKWCSGEAPNFRHKASGFEVRWYKWIGRDHEYNRKPNGEELSNILRECWDSLPAIAKQKALVEHEYENTTEYKAKEAEEMAFMFAALHKVMSSQTPCWDCSKAGMFSRKLDGSPRGGSFEGGPSGCVAKTLHDDVGRCLNCGTINTPRQDAALAKREQKNIQAMRIHFGTHNDSVPEVSPEARQAEGASV